LANGEVVTEHTEFFTDFTIYAHWKINTFTITFDPTGGTVSPRTATTGDDGRLASEPTPTRAGYTFDGWYTTAATGGTEVTTSTVFTANTTVYARWVVGTVPTYTITFDASSGTVTPKSGVTTAHGTLPSLPTPTRNGYTFVGWFTAATGGTAVSEGTIFTANGTIYAHWETKTFTVTFSSQGGSAVDEQTVTPGGLAKKPTNPTRTGYAFGDWYQDVAYTRVWHFDTDAVTEDITLFAKWVFTITFNAGDGGRVNPTSANTDASGKLASLPEPTRDGYTFDGWATAPTGGTPITTNTVFRAHTTIHAHWMVGNITKFDITLDANGEDAWITFDEGVTKAKTIVIHTNSHGTVEDLVHYPELVNIGNIHEGWFTAKSGGTKVEMDEGTKVGTKFAANTTIYAHWKPQDWNVTFSSAGPAVVSQVKGHHAKVDVPRHGTYTGWTFDAWYKEAEYTTKWDFEKGVVESDLTLYAKWNWTSTVTYKITFADARGTGANGPDGTGEPIEKYTGEGFRLAASDWPPDPKKENYAFVRWSYYVNTTNPAVTATVNTVWTAARTVTPVWVWAGAAYVITFDANGGTVSPSAAVVGEGWVLKETLPFPQRSEWYFVGWYTERTGGEQVRSGTEFKQNTTLYAHWTNDPNETLTGQFKDDRDGKIYTWTKIGTQVWMAGNLNYDGVNLDGAGSVIGFCADNDPKNCDTYGRLYTSDHAMDGANGSEAEPSGVRGACPVDWHLPSEAEWETLVSFVLSKNGNTNRADAAALLKAGSAGGTDKYGFQALMGGYSSSGTGSSAQLGNMGRWWTATVGDGTTRHRMYTMQKSTTAGVAVTTAPNGYRISVRCVMD
jgi:uncharacterized protein (TIGR02145 family)/uncharacterized repeat protein (TIGR02543 family)